MIHQANNQDLQIERLQNDYNARYLIRVRLEIAGEHYTTQVEEPRIGDAVDATEFRGTRARIDSFGYPYVVDTPEKQYKLIYWRIYLRIERLLCGEALTRTMAAVEELFRRNGQQWDSTRECYGPSPVDDRMDALRFTDPPSEYQARIMDRLTDEPIIRILMGEEGRRRFAQEYPPGFQEGPQAVQNQQAKSEVQQRAWQLLRDTIGPEQFAHLETLGYFEVQGKRGAYRFHKGKAGGVTFIATQRYGQRDISVAFDLCVQSAAAYLPEGDVILSRYLAWQADEEQFLQTANFRASRIPDEYETRNRQTMGGILAPLPWA
jgi:hypothetical protein